MGFKRLNAGDLDRALSVSPRQYLVGRLTRPQEITEMVDDRIEVGLSRYPSASTEQPHRHTHVTEYQYVISGLTEYLDVATHEVHRFAAGDFYATSPETSYAQRIKAGTLILFIKVPGQNDKVPLEASPTVRAWMDDPAW